MKKYISYLMLFLFVATLTNAQTKKEPSPTINKPIKNPELVTFLGNVMDSIITNTDQLKKIIEKPLVILDENKIRYEIVSYDLIHKKLGYNLDPKSGKEYKVFTYGSTRYTENPLPQKWQKLIGEVVIPEEEIIFTDIYVKDKQGKFYLAPSFKIILR